MFQAMVEDTHDERAAMPKPGVLGRAPARRILYVELRARAPSRLFLDELDYARAQLAALEVLGQGGSLLLSYCLLPDRLVLVTAGHAALTSTRVAQLQCRLEALFRVRHERTPPPCRITLRTVDSARTLARLCARIQELPVALGLADTPRAWGWVGPDLNANP